MTTGQSPIHSATQAQRTCIVDRGRGCVLPADPVTQYCENRIRAAMKLQQLRYLAAVVQSGLNITAAAEKLHTSQPAVSKRIALLEDSLSARLFDRLGRQVVLTEAGRLLLPRARQMLAEAEAARRARTLGCLDCHGEGLRGKKFVEIPQVVTMYAPNITRVAARATDEQLARARP